MVAGYGNCLILVSSDLLEFVSAVALVRVSHVPVQAALTVAETRRFLCQALEWREHGLLRTLFLTGRCRRTHA